MNLHHIPNLLSVFRMLLVAPAVWYLSQREFELAVAVIALAVFTDGLDGFLAKQFNWRTKLGGILDPLADKLLFVCVFITLGLLALIPTGLVALVLLRDLVIVSGGLAYHYLVGPFAMRPSMLSKLNTLSQFLFTVAVLLNAAWNFPSAGVIRLLGLLLVATTLSSGIGYVVSWGRRARNALRSKRH